MNYCVYIFILLINIHFNFSMVNFQFVSDNCHVHETQSCDNLFAILAFIQKLCQNLSQQIDCSRSMEENVWCNGGLKLSMTILLTFCFFFCGDEGLILPIFFTCLRKDPVSINIETVHFYTPFIKFLLFNFFSIILLRFSKWFAQLFPPL